MSARRFWLMKSEPAEFSFDDLLAAPGRRTAWTGVRNARARNYMRDQMRPGDRVLFYHSSCSPPGIAGIAEVASGPYPDPTQLDPASPYYDPRARPGAPRWMCVDVRAVRKTRFLPLAELRADPALARMLVLRRGNRLSITPVAATEYRRILSKLGA